MQKIISDFSAASYQHLLKPLFFQCDPEFVHDTMTRFGRLLGFSLPTRFLTEKMWSYQDKSLVKKLDGITFSNPVGLSAGFDYNGELTRITPALGFGFHTIGTVTLEPYEGNTKPRLSRFPLSKALLVNKGLKNKGAEDIISKLEREHFAIPVGISIASTNKEFASDKQQMEEIVECFRVFEASQVPHSYYELNISCPNTFGGEPFTTAPRLGQLLKLLDKLDLQRPLYLKLPIDQPVAQTIELLETAAKHNVQGAVMGNLTKNKNNPAVHPRDRAQWKKKPGNVSGKPTWELSNTQLRAIRLHFKKRFTLIGTGGIFSGQDAATKLDLGADLVQLITGMIYQGPQVVGQINSYLAERTKN
jgi:dihydroorotate dehydrogenase